MTLRHPYMNAIATAAMLMAAPALALTIGQTDTFEDGTTNGWTSGVPNPLPPQNVATGGPGGANDNYLQLRSSGTFGAGSRLVAFNLGQWAGDYGTAGAGSVVMDVNNFGATDLSLRLLFTDLAGTNAAVTPVVAVPSGSGWMEVQFAIKATDLVVLAGSAAGALAATSEVRLMHNPLPTFPPAPVAATVGIDNIELRAAGTPSGVDDTAAIPRATGLNTVYPNPFNPRVAISYAIEDASAVRVAVHDLEGRLVRVLEEGTFAAGTRTVTWDGTDGRGRRQASGAYVIELVAGARTDRRTVTMLK
jgi:hypothetical protein